MATLLLPATAPQAPEQRAAFHHACQLAEHFAELAWELAAPTPGPTVEVRAAAERGDLTAQLAVAAARAAAAEGPSADDIKRALREVEAAAAAMEKVGGYRDILELQLVAAILSVAWPDPEDGQESEGDALQRLADLHGVRFDGPTFRQAVDAARRAPLRPVTEGRKPAPRHRVPLEVFDLAAEMLEDAGLSRERADLSGALRRKWERCQERWRNISL